ncbi:MAG: MltA domain-containing protein, partial [Deltaproteobacteria bacterium]|nr:MltA domain-containing protein [Deltaproteobacteria bacterium]
MKLKKNMWLIAVAAVTVLIMLGSTGCAPTKEKVMKRVYSWFYPDFSDDIAYDGLENSILKSLSYLYKIPPDRQFVFGKDSYDTDHMIDSLQRFLDYIETQPPVNELRDFIKSNYRIYRSVGRDGRGEVLYTGYYEPLLSGSLVRSEEYPFPIYT